MLKKQIRSVLTLILIITLIVPFFATPVSAAYENTYTNTGNMRDDIIGVALTQVGYEEGSNNYTKYGVWYGLPNSPWCGMFVSWCANEAGIPTSVLKKTGIADPSSFGLSYQSGTDYTPQKGDLFFKQGFTHVGLVYYTEGSYFYTIEGNTSTTTYDGNSVMIRKRLISDFYFSSPNYSGSGSSGCSHSYETKVESDHPHKEYKICTKCQNKSYTGEQITNSSCNSCIQDVCSHTFGLWKNTGDSQHGRTCSKCGFVETKAHTWEQGEILKEATCVDEGELQVICKDCSAESTQSIKKIEEHIYTDFSYIDESNHQKVCNACNEQTMSKHTLNTSWQFNSLYHWTSCSDCNGRIQHQEHRFPNGCSVPCADCGYILESGHKGSGEKIQDATHHWELCAGCGQKVNIAQHSYTSDCDEICNSCGYQRSGTAAHQDIYQADHSGHWRKCSSCNRVTDIAPHAPDQNAKDWEALLCIHCDYELRSGDHHTHEYATVNSDAHTHWGTCQCGEIMESEIHCWDIGTGNCSVCGAMNTASEKEPAVNFLVKLWKQLWKK